MQKPDLLRPTLIAGIVFGLASSIPVINAGNCCCCLWLFASGWLATFLYANAGRRIGYGITVADGMLVGLVAGLIGGFVSKIIETFVQLALGDRMRDTVLGMLDEADIPPEFEDFINIVRQSVDQDLTIPGFVFSLIFSMFVFGLLATISGTITGALMRGRSGPVAPPPPAPPTGGGSPSGGSTGQAGSGWDEPASPSAFGPGDS